LGGFNDEQRERILTRFDLLEESQLTPNSDVGGFDGNLLLRILENVMSFTLLENEFNEANVQNGKFSNVTKVMSVMRRNHHTKIKSISRVISR